MLTLIENFSRKRTDRIKNRIRMQTARYYIRKNANEIKTVQKTHQDEVRKEKKTLKVYYEDRIELLNEKIDALERDNKFYRKQYSKYCDLKEELERASGVIDVKNLHQELNRIFDMIPAF